MPKKMEKLNEPIWEKYSVTIKFKDKVLGGIPKNPELIKDWLKGRGVPEEAAEEMKDEIAKEVKAGDEASKSWTGFKEDKTGPHLEERQVKACLKECASTLRLTAMPGFRDQVNHGVFIKPEILYFIRDGQPVATPDGNLERPIHVMGPKGPRSALSRQDYIEGATIDFEIWVAKAVDKKRGEVLPKKRLKEMLTLGQELGLGASRSQGYGKFDVVAFKPIQ